MKQVLVTGGAGFIGSHVVRSLLERYPGIRIRVMHLPKDNLINLQGLDVELFAGDITSRLDVEAAVEGCDAVFHLAAVFALWLPDPFVMRRVNVDGSRNLFQICLDKGVQRVVYTSSYAVFGGQGHGVACDETSPFRLGHSFYSYTKFEGHQLAKQYAQQGLDIVTVCPAAPVGPGDYGPTPTGKLFIDAVSAPVNMLLKTGSNYVDVRDCALGHVLAYEKGRNGESYILGGHNHTMKEVVQKVEKVTGLKRPNITINPLALYPAAYASTFLADHVTRQAPLLTPADLKTLRMGLWADITKAKTELRLPVRDLEDSIRDAVAWFIEHGYLEEKVARKIRL
jgi:dihydroflavonol-4-reductase